MKKIGIIVFNYYLANSLSLLNCATSLAKEGYDTHIFIDSFTYQRSQAHFEENNISVHQIEIRADPREDHTLRSPSERWTAFVANKASKRQDKKLSGRSSALLDAGSMLYPTVRFLKAKTTPKIQTIRFAFHARAVATPSIKTAKNYTRRFFPYIVEFYEKIVDHIDEDFVCLIGVEPFGLIAATLTADASKKEKSVPVIYYNQELLLEKECRTFESRMLKSLERVCNQMCYLTIIQDKRRAKYLLDDNNLKEGSIICVPVSGLAPATYSKGTMLQDLCGIPQEKKVLLYAGHPFLWAMWVEMAQAAQKWKDDFVLALHSYHEELKNDQQIALIRKLTESKKVFLSLKQVDWEMMPELLSSADIGLIFYPNLGENYYEIGHSSNKLVQFLQVGLPVITSDFPSLRDVIETYQCGECATGPDEIEQLAEKIFQDYDRYRANAFRCYEREYNFAKYFAKVIKRIKAI